MKRLHDILRCITPEVYQNLRRAIEVGRWSNGMLVEEEQKALCMQALIAYEKKYLPPEQHTGYIECKAPTDCGGSKQSSPEIQILNFEKDV